MKKNITTSSFYSLYKISQTNYPKCEGQQKSTYICCNHCCFERNPFVCCQKKCFCQQKHKLCSKVDINIKVSAIESKVIDNTKIQNHIFKITNNLIQKLNEFAQNLCDQIEKNIRFIGLNKSQRQFLKIFDKDGIKIKKHHLFQSNKQNQQSQQKLIQLYEIIGKYIQNLFQSTLQSIKLIQSKVKKFSIEKEEQYIFFQEQQQFRLRSFEDNIYQKSSILKQQLIIKKLFDEFFQQKPSNAKILFKSSQHLFHIKSFYQICSKISNLLIIASNEQNDFIYGGYTSFTFQPTGKYNYLGQQWVKDSNKQSFIFKLSTQQPSKSKVFKIQKNKDAIKRSQTKSNIQFGYDQFILIDQGRQTQGIFNVSGTNYILPKEQKSQVINFKVKQWEVWKIQWDYIKKNFVKSQKQSAKDLKNSKDKKTQLFFQQQQQMDPISIFKSINLNL